MRLSPLLRLAVIADPHIHDMRSDFGLADLPAPAGAFRSVRPLADTLRSTRVFNESEAAFREALETIAADGIRHVVLLGDYSDDGQGANIAAIKGLLDDYARRYGMRFHATPGNHDVFAMDGRHRTKRFLLADGATGIVTSDLAYRDRKNAPVTVDAGMYCQGYRAGLDPMAGFGFFPQKSDLHWETPFGRDGEFDTRTYTVRSPSGQVSRSMMDASYLVEPVAGVWLMMIDANVFVPADGVAPGAPGDFADSTAAGWNAMPLHKPFVLDWMKDVSSRAAAQGKALLAFSHYPVLDPLDGTLEDEKLLLGVTAMTQRIPLPAVGAALIAAGIDVHFSGHLHVNDTARMRKGGRSLTNVAVPSLVGFPSAYKEVAIHPDRLDIRTVALGASKPDPALMRLYRIETARTGMDAGDVLEAQTYGDFLNAHIGRLALRRYLKRDWPSDLADALRGLTLADLAALSRIDGPVPVQDAVEDARAVAGTFSGETNPALAPQGATSSSHAAITALDFLQDWYRLRMGSDLALDWILPERLESYRAVSRLFAERWWAGSACAQTRFALMFRMFDAFASGLPSLDFSIDRRTGEIVRQ